MPTEIPALVAACFRVLSIKLHYKLYLERLPQAERAASNSDFLAHLYLGIDALALEMLAEPHTQLTLMEVLFLKRASTLSERIGQHLDAAPHDQTARASLETLLRNFNHLAATIIKMHTTDLSRLPLIHADTGCRIGWFSVEELAPIIQRHICDKTYPYLYLPTDDGITWQATSELITTAIKNDLGEICSVIDVLCQFKSQEHGTSPERVCHEPLTTTGPKGDTS